MTTDIFKALICGFLLTVAAGCASTPKNGADIGPRMTEQEYGSLINKHTRHAVKYEGFYNKFDIYATYMNTEVQAAILQRRSDLLQWDNLTAQKEREKMFQENTTRTQFAISMFIPSTRLNDLHRGNSIWKIYLDAGGQRYEGKASRRNGKLEDIVETFPYHNRWSTPYDITFDVPLSVVEQSSVTLILTSSQGTAKLEFPAIKSDL